MKDNRTMSEWFEDFHCALNNFGRTIKKEFTQEIDSGSPLFPLVGVLLTIVLAMLLKG